MRASAYLIVLLADRTQLCTNLKTYPDTSGLCDLCLDLGTDHDSLQGKRKGDKFRELGSIK
jgi:hypothetical protein